MQFYRIFYCWRLFICNKSRFPIILGFLLLTFLFILSTSRTSIRSNPTKKTLDLLAKEKVLVPVSINQLYDYRVICPEKNGVLNHSNLLDRLAKTCQVHLNGSWQVNLSPPEDFQIRAPSTRKYLELWQTSDSCSLYRNESIAIIIPYRDREKNLQNLLYNLIPFLQKQKITHYKIFIIEQQASGAFNKGRLYNIAFNHLMETSQPTCVIFHDVDLIPENDQNLYSCLTTIDHPLHMSANVRFHLNKSYTTIYSFLVGGVLSIRPQTFVLLNGYSNEYFNWGGEDDDIGLRFLAKDICVQRPTNGFYYAHSHSTQERNKNRFKLLFDAVLRQDTDGLTNINQLAMIEKVYEYPLVTWMTVQWIDRSSV